MEMKNYEFIVQLPDGGHVKLIESGRTIVEAQRLVEGKYPNAKSVMPTGEV
jgi:hypothetical protein